MPVQLCRKDAALSTKGKPPLLHIGAFNEAMGSNDLHQLEQTIVALNWLLVPPYSTKLSDTTLGIGFFSLKRGSSGGCSDKIERHVSIAR